ncbi:MAG: acetyl-CoA C-acyltransferase [Deltaproteobacteria bacterium]|nr:acetyl-CoA C-acyltransferase [Deltaproteobacteria bacterium]
MREVVVVSAVRTPIGAFQGALASLTAPKLGSVVIAEALKRAQLSPGDVSEVIMGEVLTAGVGQAPARQAALGAGLPNSVPCLTVNKVCGSGLKAVMLARQAIALGDADVVVAGGMESMSNAPYLLPTARGGMRMGNATAVDSMIHDGLWDPYGNAHMGNFGDACAREHDFTREAQDAFTKTSYERALAAQKSGWFAGEIVGVEVKEGKDVRIVDTDEEPGRFKPEKIGALKPAFAKDGTITAANASKIDDGAAALVLMSADEAKRRGLVPLCTLVADAQHAKEPAQFTTAPAGAIDKALKKAGLKPGDVDLYEINEAFAVVAMVTMKQLALAHDKVNVWGGAVALGHPIGGSGARIFTTLLSQMKRLDKKLGCASLCIGGGEAVAVVARR